MLTAHELLADDRKKSVVKPRVLVLSDIVPDTDCGARLALYRHFVQRDDFEVSVASVHGERSKTRNNFIIRHSGGLERLRHTRFARCVYNLDYWRNWKTLPMGLEAFARKVKPDIIFNVPDNIHPGWAWQISRRLRVPLAVDFQDLTPISKFEGSWGKPFPTVAEWLLKRYHFLNDHAELVFHTSEGMRTYFGDRPDGHVLYPMGDAGGRVPTPALSPASRMQVIYAGNCYGSYGRLLRRLAHLVKNEPLIDLKIYPVGGDWPEAEVRELEAAGILQQFMPFEELLKKLEQADAFLTVMSFEASEKPFVSTSFTTKWLDYVPFGKPIFAWGPAYSTASTFAQKHGCGLVVNEDDPARMLRTMLDLRSNRQKWGEISQAVCRVAMKELNSEAIHRGFVHTMRQACGASRTMA